MDANVIRALEDLVLWQGELPELTKSTRHGAPTPIVTLRRRHVTAAAERAIAGRASPSQLIEWAQAVHFEDRVGTEEGHQDLLTQFLVEISTPELFEPVTRGVCQGWLYVLQTSMTSAPEVSGR
ncbi:hypothetical protein [Streptomyces sp. YS-3]|uniref:hypothetical protein n=1 Tax=Streptomyces sp. YS-3 TaxID=3381352 RepID=UPI003862B191